jgi:hypothetical protein
MRNDYSRLRLPTAGAARLYALTDVHGFAWAVIAASEPERARLECLTRPGCLSAMLTHPEGVAWPDWRGERLAIETLAIGGTVCMAFGNVADAIRCKRRLEGGGR